METPKYLWTKIDAQGRVVIPATVRKLMSIEEGDAIAFVVDGSRVSLMTLDQGIESAQSIARRYFKREPGRSIVDEFIAERRAEAARE